LIFIKPRHTLYKDLWRDKDREKEEIMKTVRIINAMAAAFFITSSAPAAYCADRIAAIYGKDSRAEVIHSHKTIQILADSTVALFLGSNLKFDGNSGQYFIEARTFEEEYNLPPDHRFARQPAASFCSGAYVGRNPEGKPIVFTAGHCVSQSGPGFTCGRDKVVFGYAVSRDGKAPAGFAREEVYGCRVLARRKDAGADYAVLELDRVPADHEPLAINRSGAVKTGTSVFVIGHPGRLPAKVTGDATVTLKEEATEERGFFSTNLDTFGGNSGSPVFNEKTLMIEGILVSGKDDYITNPLTGDNSEARYRHEDTGETATKISEISGYIEPTATEAYLIRRELEINEGLRQAPDLGLSSFRVAMPGVESVPAVSGQEEMPA